MSFPRTRFALLEDSPAPLVVGILLVGGLLSAWTAWFALAPITLYAATPTARLEVVGQPSSVEPVRAGRVALSRLEIGRMVRQGEVLVELDRALDRNAHEQATARLRDLSGQLAALEGQIRAQERATLRSAETLAASVREAQARLEETRAKARLAREHARRSGLMWQADAGTEMDARRAASEADALEASVRAQAAALDERALERRSLQEHEAVQLAALRRERTALEGELAATRLRRAAIEQDLERGVIRAPVSGRIGEAAPLRPGSFVREGDRLATLIPTDTLRLVADFAPQDALGRIRIGQGARLHLDGYPWMQYGSVAATVSAVASEVRYGRIRVELAVAPHTRLPLQHGLPGALEVAVERVTPLQLALRAAGQALTQPIAARGR